MQTMKIMMVSAAIFSLNGFVSAGENLDIKGSFGSELAQTVYPEYGKTSYGLPKGWIPNLPSWWDAAGKTSLNKIPGTEKYALQLTSQTKKMSVYYFKKWPISPGDKCIVKAIVKGIGTAELGIIFYPGQGCLSKGFTATEERTEFTAEIEIPKVSHCNTVIEQIIVILGVSQGASIEFLDVTAEIVKKE